MAYERTDEQYRAVKAIRDRLDRISKAALRELTALRLDVHRDATFVDANDGEFGAPENRASDAIDVSKIARAFEEVRMALLDWEPDHGVGYTPCPPDEYGA